MPAMLLRTSSAPVLSALNSGFYPADACKDFVEPASNVHGSNLSCFHALASPSPRPGRMAHGTFVGEDAHAGLCGDQEFGSFGRSKRLSRAQSEGDLARFSVATAAANSYCDRGLAGSEDDLYAERSRRGPSFNVKESILEEADETEEIPSPRLGEALLLTHGLNRSVSQARKFALNDGEVFSGVNISSSGSPVACNDKGCRPLTEVECKQLGILDMASGIGSGNFGWSSGNNGNSFSNDGDSYYQRLLESDPGNQLILRNYAEYLLKKGEVKKAEEYYGRAILADPNDGEVLSSYAKLQWEVNRDQDRAEAYYGQAVQAAPDDCYIMASYASFLWDVEDDKDQTAAPYPLSAYDAPAKPVLLASG